MRVIIFRSFRILRITRTHMILRRLWIIWSPWILIVLRILKMLTGPSGHNHLVPLCNSESPDYLWGRKVECIITQDHQMSTPFIIIVLNVDDSRFLTLFQNVHLSCFVFPVHLQSEMWKIFITLFCKNDEIFWDKVCRKGNQKYIF